jgi:hypothetical protein
MTVFYFTTRRLPGPPYTISMDATAAVTGDRPDDLSADFILEYGEQLTADLHDKDYAPDGGYPLRAGQAVNIDLEAKVRGSGWNVWAIYPRG